MTTINYSSDLDSPLEKLADCYDGWKITIKLTETSVDVDIYPHRHGEYTWDIARGHEHTLLVIPRDVASAKPITEWLRKREDLLEQIQGGYTYAWSPRNQEYVGRLDDVARETLDELAFDMDREFAQDNTTLQRYWDVYEWLQYSEPPRQDRTVEKIMSLAKSDNVCLDLDEVKAYIAERNHAEMVGIAEDIECALSDIGVDDMPIEASDQWDEIHVTYGEVTIPLSRQQAMFVLDELGAVDALTSDEAWYIMLSTRA